MPPAVQVVIDCANPGRLIRFWAAALDYDIQFPTGSEEERRLLAEHPGLEGTAAAAIDRKGIRPRLYLQRVPEAKTVKNRIHLDLSVPDIAAEAERLQALGATVLEPVRAGSFGEHWIVMADPEGNEFCVAEARPADE